MSKGAGGSSTLRRFVTQYHREIYRGKIGEAGPLGIYAVNAKIIRDKIWEDWIGGGNGEAYPWMPDEIWIEHTLDAAEVPLFKLHELHEYNKMRAGLTYEKAHKSASGVEQEARDHPERLGALWRREVEIVSKGR
jgi:hypothetical protein